MRLPWVLGPPRRNAKHQLGKVICEGIDRDFRGQFVSVLVDSLLEINLLLRLFIITTDFLVEDQPEKARVIN